MPDRGSSPAGSADGPGVFFSYRRDDTSAVAARLANRLIDELGESRVFLDVVAMEPGEDFRRQLRKAIARSSVMLVLIGPGWLTATDDNGGRRLDDPQDHVRREIDVGLLLDLRVIPVLVGGAAMPRSTELPADLAPLADRQALRIDHPTFRRDDEEVVRRVVARLRELEVRDTPPDPRRPERRRLGLYASVLAVVVVLVGASLLAWSRWPATGPASVPLTTVPSAPSFAPLPRGSGSDAPVPDASTAATPVPEPATVVPGPGQASIRANYDPSDGCGAVATITGDLHGDPRTAGRVLWVVAVLDATPNVLYYPKTQVSAPDGRFSVPIDLNQSPGNRRGRFGLVVSPTDRARDDLQRSLDADVAKNDSAYPDDRRTQLQLGNIEIATTPFVPQQC